MTLSPFIVYSAMQADRVGFFFIILTATLGIFALFSFISADCTWNEEAKAAKVRRGFKFTSGAILAALLFALSPSTKTIAAMVILPTVVNNEQVQALPADILGFVRGLIREYTPKEEDAKL